MDPYGRMKEDRAMGKRGYEPAIVRMEKPTYALGAGMDSSDSRIMKDAAVLGSRFAELRGRTPFEAVSPRLFVAATSGYDRGTGEFRYAMGDVVADPELAPAGLERIAIPEGTYAAFVVRPLLGFLWGPAIGKAYAYIFGTWLPRSTWRHDPRPAPGGRRLEHFEYHDERASRKRGPEMEIRVPIAPKA
jgi:predicted transcriptional regulator YdeE